MKPPPDGVAQLVVLAVNDEADASCSAGYIGSGISEVSTISPDPLNSWLGVKSSRREVVLARRPRLAADALRQSARDETRPSTLPTFRDDGQAQYHGPCSFKHVDSVPATTPWRL